MEMINIKDYKISGVAGISKIDKTKVADEPLRIKELQMTNKYASPEFNIDTTKIMDKDI